MRRFGYYFGFLLIITLVWIAGQWPSSQVMVTLCDVGQGDGLIIQEGFSQMIVDTGPPNGSMVSCLGETLPFWDRHLEAVVISHADSDHSGGLVEISQRYQIKHLITTALAADAMQSQLSDSIHIATAKAGDRWQFGSITGHVLWPMAAGVCRDANSCSLVVRLSHQTDSLLLTGDVNIEVEEQLQHLGYLIPTTYVKISHHGAGSSTGDPFLRILRPRQVWISVGKNNRYGHPAKDTLLRITRNNASIWRTDEQGSVTLPLH